MEKITIKNLSYYSSEKVINLNQDGENITLLNVFGEKNMEVSDGYHTFSELYDHRITLFIALCRAYAIDVTEYKNKYIWRSKRHSDGELAFGGTWFVLGIGKAKGEQITYHLPIERWNETEFAETLDKAPEWDGHSPADVLERLKKL